MRQNNVLAFDCDGVMLHYQSVYPAVWKEAFGEDIQVVRPNCYHATNMYGVSFKNQTDEDRFYETFDHRYWSAMDPLEGALDACNLLVAKGYRLVCVTAMPERYEQARLSNLRRLGFPIDCVIATGSRAQEGENPKLQALTQLQPLAFVDDRLDNFKDLAPMVHRAWIDGKHEDCPSAPLRSNGWHDTEHPNLLDFAHWWAEGDARPLSA